MINERTRSLVYRGNTYFRATPSLTPYTYPMLRYAITDRSHFPGDESTRQSALLQQTAALAASGINYLQLREKDLDTATLATLAHALLATFRTRSPAPKLLINSRADIAVATAADGVHLTSAPGELTPTQIRQLYASANLPEPIVSVSCHTLTDVAAARDSGATLILFGPVFEKVAGTQSISAGTGLGLLRSACATGSPTPILALGGITSENTSACLAAGAAGIAAIRLFAR
jgi:thiamine-phosphate pyrophosphorylase